MNDTAETIVNRRVEYDWSSLSRELDDAQLSPYAFRVYMHFLRRSDRHTYSCYPGVAKIAETCLMDRKAVMRAISELEARGFIWVDRSWGRKSDYHINKKTQWTEKKKTEPKTEESHQEPVPVMDQFPQGTSANEVQDQSNRGTGTSPLEVPPPVPLMDTKVIQGRISNEGNPSKDSRARVKLGIPLSLDTAEFREIWFKLEGHLQEKGNPMTRQTRLIVLAEMERIGLNASLRQIQKCIRGGWRNFRFEGDCMFQTSKPASSRRCGDPDDPF